MDYMTNEVKKNIPNKMCTHSAHNSLSEFFNNRPRGLLGNNILFKQQHFLTNESNKAAVLGRQKGFTFKADLMKQ